MPSPESWKEARFLERFKLRDERQDDFFCRANDRIGNDGKMEQTACFADDLLRNGMALGKIAFGDGLRITLAAGQQALASTQD